jgi:hypothetical protein
MPLQTAMFAYHILPLSYNLLCHALALLDLLVYIFYSLIQQRLLCFPAASSRLDSFS